MCVCSQCEISQNEYIALVGWLLALFKSIRRVNHLSFLTLALINNKVNLCFERALTVCVCVCVLPVCCSCACLTVYVVMFGPNSISIDAKQCALMAIGHGGVKTYTHTHTHTHTHRQRCGLSKGFCFIHGRDRCYSRLIMIDRDGSVLRQPGWLVMSRHTHCRARPEADLLLTIVRIIELSTLQ